MPLRRTLAGQSHDGGEGGGLGVPGQGQALQLPEPHGLAGSVQAGGAPESRPGHAKSSGQIRVWWQRTLQMTGGHSGGTGGARSLQGPLFPCFPLRHERGVTGVVSAPRPLAGAGA